MVASALTLLAGCASWRPPERVEPQYAGSIRSRDVERGRHVFVTLCAACHRGRVNPAGFHWTPAHMRHQIREGNNLMPPLRAARLPDDQVEAVLAYLSTIDAIDGPLPPDPDELPEDAAWGAPVLVTPAAEDEPAAPAIELDAPLVTPSEALGEPT